jgi:ABC-type multidrug transport system fused ATPase/permease subunit
MKTSSTTRTTQKSLFYWAVQDKIKLQILLLLLIVAMVFLRVLPLEMQKRIINDAISLRDFHGLLVYCGIYLAAVSGTALIKLCTNYIQAVIGEQAMLAMRKELYSHIIGLPLQFFRNTQPGMVVAALMTELSTAANFAGMALAAPISNVLTLLAFAGYLLWLNSKLALVTLSIYPVVAFLIPYLQKKANRLNKQRVDQSRLLSSQIAESITGVTEINVHGAYAQEKAKFNVFAEALRQIRTKWSLLRFSIKTINNYFAGLGPFVVFLFGGYLVMEGELELGSLVAFLSAQEKLYDPWKELIEYYQVYQDASVRYYRTMQYFDSAAEHTLEIAMDSVPAMEGRVEVENLGFVTVSGIKLLKGVSFSLPPGESLAVVGFSGSGKSTLVHCIAKMFDYSSGSIRLDGREVREMEKQEIIQHIGYIAQTPFIFSGTIRENLLYAHEAAAGQLASAASGYQAPEQDQLILALQQAGLFVDVVRFGLNSFLGPDESEMIAKMVRIRKEFRENYGESLQGFIEFYRKDTYLYHADIAENIIFGAPLDKSYQLSSLSSNRLFRDFLSETGLTNILFGLGCSLAQQVMDSPVEIDGVPVANSPVADKLKCCCSVVRNLEGASLGQLSTEEQTFLLQLALGFRPGEHEEMNLQMEIEKPILQARTKWREWSERVLPDTFSYFEEQSYVHGESIFNNIIFGRTKSENSKAQENLNQNIIRLLIEEDCLEAIAEAGMDYQLGSMGNLLSGGQKQKLAIARVLLKNSKIILMDEATSALDNKSQSRIQNLIEKRWRGRRTVVAVVHRLDSISGFDKIAVMKAGKLMEFGTYEELIAKKELLHELVFGKK